MYPKKISVLTDLIVYQIPKKAAVRHAFLYLGTFGKRSSKYVFFYFFKIEFEKVEIKWKNGQISKETDLLLGI